MKILKENKVLTEDRDSLKEKIDEYIYDLRDEQKMWLWNEYCDRAGYSDDAVYSFDEETINEMFSSPYDALRASYFGTVSFNDNYFKFNGYANLETGDIDDLADFDDMIDYIIDNDDDLGEPDIREIIDEENEEDEE